MKEISLHELAGKAVRKAQNLGSTEAEAYVEHRRVMELFMEREDFKTFRMKEHFGVGVRSIVDKRIGFSHISRLSDESLEEVCKAAFKNAKLSPRLEDWISLPSPKPLPKVEGIYDDQVVMLDEAGLVELAKRAYDAVYETDGRAHLDDGKITVEIVERAICNSNGILVGDEGTWISGYITCIASENGEVSSFAYTSRSARRLVDFKPEDIGSEAAKLAVRSLHPKRIEPFKGKVLFEWTPTASLLLSAIAYSVNAEMVQRKSSLWAGKINSKVAVDMLEIVDDGLLPAGLSTSSFDGEGVRRQKTPIIMSGTLKNYLYDSYTAYKEGRESTGNAGRGEYSTTPSISPSNMILKEGGKSIDDLILEMDKGLLVGRFSGNLNPSSGIFSGIAKQSVYVENGEIKHAVKETMISGNIYQLLNNIVEIGKPVRPVYSAYVPPILIDGVNIVSKS